MYIRGEILEDN